VSRPRILVVDDDRDARESLVDALATEGYLVLEAEDGEQALALLRSGRRPALILLDLMMPRTDGATFRRAQMTDASLARIPVVVVTAYEISEEHASALRAAAYLAKPPELSALLDVVSRLAPPK